MSYISNDKNIKSVMISIVTTCYNLEDYIEDCLVSLINQSYENLEIIVVNDCSTDNSLSIIKKIADKDSRIKIINNDINLGAGKSRKIGIESANGDYIMLLDGDDWITSNYLKTLYDSAKSNDADIVTGYLNGNKYRCRLSDKWIFESEDEKLYYLQHETLNFINNKLIKKSLWDKVPYCEKRYIEDRGPYIKLIYYANKIVSLEDFKDEYYFYTKRQDSLTNSASSDKNKLFFGLSWMELYEFFKEKNTKFKSIYNIYKVRNVVGNFFYPGNADIEKIKNEYINEYNELFLRWNKLRSNG